MNYLILHEKTRLTPEQKLVLSTRCPKQQRITLSNITAARMLDLASDISTQLCQFDAVIFIYPEPILIRELTAQSVLSNKFTVRLLVNLENQWDLI